MSNIPSPPAEVDSPKNLLEEVQAAPEQWFQYISQLYNQNNAMQEDLEEANENNALLRVRNGALEKESQSLQEQSKQQAGVIAY
jgi:regulator of replication initiation timing